ncbi:Tc toxin subunit A-related protein [Sphingopyxis panaciterrae]
MKAIQASSFLTVTPIMELRPDLVAIIGVATGPSAQDKANAVLAKAKLRIRDGDAAYKSGRYEAALTHYKAARGLLYAQLHPGFNFNAYAAATASLLPVSEALEAGMMQVGVQLLDAAQPLTKPATFLNSVSAPALTDDLKFYNLSGYQAAGSGDVIDTLERSAGLLADGRAAGAIELLEAARISPGRASAGVQAALALNLATAHVQAGDAAKGSEVAEEAAALFARARDKQGQAQALHVAAVGLSDSNARRADELFTEAAALVGDGSVRIGERGAPVPRLRELPQAIAEKRRDVLAVRSGSGAGGWTMIPRTETIAQNWKVGIGSAAGPVAFEVAPGKGPTADMVMSKLYDVRVSAVNIADLIVNIADGASASVYVNHLYSFVLTMKIGDALHALGRYLQAEDSYKQAAAYKYLNKAHEAPAVWLKLAANVMQWGDSLYRDEKIEAARAQYEKFVTEDFDAPAASFLYKLDKLSGPAAIAKARLAALGTGTPGTNSEIGYYVLTAASRMQSILDGLDFFGTLLSPIHTFEYLQGVARGFAQSAIQAEREFVNFTTQQEAETATRRELETMVAMAKAETAAKQEAVNAAKEDVDASQAALDLAKERKENAKRQRDDYAEASWQQIWAAAAAQALGGGESAMFNTVVALADRLDNGETIKGAGPLLAAAVTYRSGRRTREYELAKMDDNIADLAGAVDIAQEMLNAAEARLRVAEIAAEASAERAAMAEESIEAFDSEMFTPEVWAKMAWVMRGISTAYLHDAIRLAKLMQRAFNFENDTSIALIKNGYGHAMVNATTGGSTTLLGGDSLVRDIDAFTFQAITGRTRKNSRIKDTISIARNFPAQFEEFRRTGVLELETDLYEFDRLHPGFHNQRIEAVEVEFAGLLPPEGINGMVRCGGVTSYRTRARGTNKRVHQVDTMALSDFTVRGDLFIYTPEVGLRGLFQGMGLATTWKLHLPRRSNDFDYARIFDINLVVYYTAQFDPLLRKTVLSSPVRPGELTELRNFDLRFDFPESWYALYKDGIATFAFRRDRLPFNQQDFSVASVNFRVVTKAGVAAQGIELKITGPSGASGSATTGADGSVSSAAAALAGLENGSPVGDWKVEVVGGAPLADGDAVKFDRIHNIQMGLEYGFEFVAEEL